ncbi:MAG: response regulator [Bacteroidia bacterium]|nr:response regulator [Bacteroidia bacterium]
MRGRIPDRKVSSRILAMMTAPFHLDFVRYIKHHMCLFYNYIYTIPIALQSNALYSALVLILVFSFWNPVFGDADDFKIKKISPEGGFTFDAISSICEDKYGFIWFGSNNGAYRNNSVETLKFINSPDDKTSIPSNFIRSIYLDMKGEIWISTDHGLSVFDYQCECFKRYSFHDAAGNPMGLNVAQIFQTADSTYWMVDNAGFAGIDFKTGIVSYYPLPENIPNDRIRMAVKDKNERIWLGGNIGGIYYCDPPYQKISFFAQSRTENVFTILPDGNKIWIGYDWGGADLFTTQGEFADHFDDNIQGKNKIPSSRVRTIFKYKNEIWLGTFKGLVRMKDDGIEVIEKEKYPGLPSNSIFQIFRDSKNGIWITTWSGGLGYINEWSNNFEHYKRESNNNSLSDNVVSDFAETADGKIIIATEEGHLNYLDPSNHQFTDVRIKEPNGMVNHIKSLYTDKNGTLWIGTFASGIFFKNKDSRDYQNFGLIDKFKEQFYDITSSDEGLWFASSMRGLFYYDYKTRQVRRYSSNNSDPESLSSNQVRTVLDDSKGNIWVGTASGLNKRSKGSDRFVRYFYNPDERNRISSNNIYTLIEDSKQNIWIGTAGGGVNIYDPNSGEFLQLSKKDGLPGNDIYGILEDNAGVIWMSTENGISAYTPATKNIRNFDYTDGIQGNQFNPGSAFKAKNGELFFGGSNGFTRFDPQQMKENPVTPKVFITGLEINNQTVNQISDPKLIRQSLMTLSYLELKYNQNSLKFNFVANNFLLPQKNRYKYRLMGYSPDWIEIQKDNKAIFTKIPPGDYVFEVIAANNDGKWNDSPTRLHLTILYPFWRTFYAYLIYFIITIVVFYFLQRELRIRNRLKHSILQEKIQRENEEKLHQLKLHFFTNISHEFRTPLTLILSPLSLLKRKMAGQEETMEHLTMIENNANRLTRLVNQILDIRKIELGKMDFQPQPFDIVALCQEVLQCFSLLDNDRKINFHFESDFSSLFISIEPDKIDKMIFNLLSNAMKYTREEGTIQLSIKNPYWQPEAIQEPYHYAIGNKIDGEYVTVIVKNEGSGIAPSDLPNIFDRFYQAPGQLSGTGIGLHLCSEYILMHHGQIEVFTGENLGSSFYVRLPVSREEIGKGIQQAVFHTSLYQEQQIQSLPEETLISKSEKETTILVVEDNKEMLRFLKNILSELYHIITASDGNEGLTKVKEFHPDLVLTDVMMPVMNGTEFCHILKTDLDTSHIPVLMLTALSSVENQMQGFETGADDYIVKPFDDRLLTLRIRNLLESRRILRDKFTNSQGEWREAMQTLKPDRELLEKATTILENHLTDMLFTVDTLASALGLSRSTLHRKLKALTNQSATEFMKFVRINKSIKLIESGMTNIDEICFKVGFNSHSYYSMCFKKQLGQTPSEYISRLKREAKQ